MFIIPTVTSTINATITFVAVIVANVIANVTSFDNAFLILTRSFYLGAQFDGRTNFSFLFS